MQRLTARLRRRSGDERGATAVIVALLMVPMLGFTAIAVDIGRVYAERARLQVAADAAALAVAQDCARGSCGDMQATASSLVTANDAGSTAAPPVLSDAPLSVTVTGDRPTQHWFAPVIGIDATTVTATATVAWGVPGAGTAVLPLTFSWCEWNAQTGGGMPSGTTPRVILFPKKSGTGCTGQSGMFVPGGFGWLVSNGDCTATTAIGQNAASEPGNNPSKGCSPSDFEAWVNKTVLLPIFDTSGGEGSHAWYHVYAYAAFTITGYYFAGQYSVNKPCSGSERCIAGYFTRFVDGSDRFTYTNDGPDLGAAILRLVR